MNGEGNKNGSTIFGVSMRAWLAFMVVGTVCAQQLSVAIANILKGESVMIEEPLYSLSVMALGFYFGQKNPGTVSSQPTIESK